MTNCVETMGAVGLAKEVQRTHGAEALDYAINTTKRHLHTAEWKNGALWLQVVNRLNASKVHAQSSTGI